MADLETSNKKYEGDGAYASQGGPNDILPSGEYVTQSDDIQVGLKRQLKSRHLAMISIGGVM